MDSTSADNITATSQALKQLSIEGVSKVPETQSREVAVGSRPTEASTTTYPDVESETMGAAEAQKTLTETSEVWNEKPDSVASRSEAIPNGPPIVRGIKTDMDDESRPEIQDIMEQFYNRQGSSESEESALTKTTSLPVFQYPPRRSSLEQLSRQNSSTTIHEASAGADTTGRHDSMPIITFTRNQDPEKASIISHATTVSAPPPPEPDPEPTLPFDFHRFLEQLRHRTADPVARYLRSFLIEFGKKQWMAHEQVKVISDFLTFIANKMGQCEVWRTVSDAEFDNAREGMEKLVMNRLYTQTFSPEIVPAETPLSPKRRQKASSMPLGPGRKGQHQEDVERDEVLAQKIRIYSWIKEEHLDMKPFTEKSKKFLVLAQQGLKVNTLRLEKHLLTQNTELIKIKSYRAPRDKVICVLNCCKVLFGRPTLFPHYSSTTNDSKGFLRNANSDQSADSFIPLLIYTVLKANPDHLVSNVQYILRFRNQDKLGGEAGYYMSSLMGAVQFIENLDRTNLTITDQDFEKNVEAAVSTIAAQQREIEVKTPSSSQHLPFTEKSTLSRPEVMARNSTDAEHASALRRGRAAADNSSTANESDEGDAVSGLLRTIQKPLSTIGRIFSDESTTTTTTQRTISDRPAATPQLMRSPRTSPRPPTSLLDSSPLADEEQRVRFEAEDAAARQASAEAAEAHSLQRAEHATVVE